MSTIQIIKKWLPKPTKSPLESYPVKENENLSVLHEAQPKPPLSIEDIVGLSWVLSDD